MTSDLSVPILVGPRMAAALPAADTASQGEYLLEGLSRHCELFAPAAWPELVSPWPSAHANVAGEEDFDGSASPLASAQPLLSSARATGRP
jgi:hypothetical protein